MVRPTADRVKEAMFNVLGSRPSGARVLDLFAGSGALGIEAISRGSRSAVFIDKDIQALKVLRQNLEHCRIHSSTDVIQWNIQKNLDCLRRYRYAFDLVFMDPPYHRNLVEATLRQLLLVDCLTENVVIVAEHEPDCHIDLSEGALLLTDSRRYGRTQLSFFGFHTAP